MGNGIRKRGHGRADAAGRLNSMLYGPKLSALRLRAVADDLHWLLSVLARYDFSLALPSKTYEKQYSKFHLA